MGNPVMPDLAQGAAEALGGTVHAGSGIEHIAYGANKNSNPSLMARLKNFERKILDHLAADSQGLVISRDSGLTVGVFQMRYRIGASDYFYAGDASFAVTASATTYLWLESDQVLHASTMGWPVTDHVRLAKVTAAASSISGVVDCRFMNYQAGVINAWSAVPASADVELDAHSLNEVGFLNLADATTLTLASDVITPTQMLHKVDTQGGAATDDLVTIALDSAAHHRRLLLLSCVNGGRVVTVKSTGNIRLKFGNAVLDDVDKFILLVQADTTRWVEVCRNFQTLSAFNANVDADEFGLTNLGLLQFAEVAVSVVSNAITRTATRHEVDGSAPVTLRTINGGSDGDILILSGGGGAIGGGVTVESATGNIILPVATAFLGYDGQFLVLVRMAGVWYPLWNSLSIELLATLDAAFPFPVAVHYPGALSDNQATFVYRTNRPFKMRKATGRVVTAPSGGSCVIDVLKNGASVFSGSSNAINITAGNTYDVSSTVDVDFAAGDELTVKVLTASGAASATVAIDAFATATNPYA